MIKKKDILKTFVIFVLKKKYLNNKTATCKEKKNS